MQVAENALFFGRLLHTSQKIWEMPSRSLSMAVADGIFSNILSFGLYF
jgi:hypothetical protein